MITLWLWWARCSSAVSWGTLCWRRNLIRWVELSVFYMLYVTIWCTVDVSYIFCSDIHEFLCFRTVNTQQWTVVRVWCIQDVPLCFNCQFCISVCFSHLKCLQVSDNLEKKEAVLSEVLSAANLDPVSFNQVSHQLEVCSLYSLYWITVLQ